MKSEKQMLLENRNHYVWAYYCFGFESHRANLSKWQIDLCNENYRKSLYMYQIKVSKKKPNEWHTLVN